MFVLAILRVALAALARHRLRTLLTMLGITIGVAAVICTVALGEAASRQIEQQLAELGDNWIWIEAGNRSLRGVSTGGGGSRLTKEDMNAILELPAITACSPQVDTRIQLVRGNQNWNTMYRGVSPEYLDIRRWPVVAGSPFTEFDVASYSKVCVLGQVVAEKLFGDEDPVGQAIRVRNLPFVVLGVLKAKGASGTANQDDTLLMPYTTAQRHIAGVRWFQDIMCSASSPSMMEGAKEQIAAVLRSQHRLLPDAPDDFTILRPEETLQLREESARTMGLMLSAIAAVSLVVGGVGILNIMLVSVVERTREIGIRLAVGARGRDIRLQFVAEAIVLSAGGGLLGILTAVGAAGVLSDLSGWAMAISEQSVTTAVAVSAAVGMVFGYYPASRAAQLDPIDALRAE
jgi:putative ABC transport system permease protein